MYRKLSEHWKDDLSEAWTSKISGTMSISIATMIPFIVTKVSGTDLLCSASNQSMIAFSTVGKYSW